MRVIVDTNDVLDDVELADSVNEQLISWQRKNPERILYQIMVNGVQYVFADDWNNIMEMYLDSAQEIHVTSAPKEELLLDLAGSMKEYIEKLLTGIDELATRFQLNPDGQDWSRLGELLEGIDFLGRSLLLLSTPVYDNAHLHGILLEMMKAMEAQDALTIGDLMIYELKAWLEMLQTAFDQN